MTDCALTAPTTRPERTAPRTRRPQPRSRSRQRSPHGIPRWARLFGVAVVPLDAPEPRDPHDPHVPSTWVISAGVGTGHITALFHDGSDVDPAGH